MGKEIFIVSVVRQAIPNGTPCVVKTLAFKSEALAIQSVDMITKFFSVDGEKLSQSIGGIFGACEPVFTYRHSNDHFFCYIRRAILND